MTCPRKHWWSRPSHHYHETIEDRAIPGCMADGKTTWVVNTCCLCGDETKRGLYF